MTALAEAIPAVVAAAAVDRAILANRDNFNPSKSLAPKYLGEIDVNGGGLRSPDSPSLSYSSIRLLKTLAIGNTYLFS